MGQLLEILFFALISAYLFYKLWMVMGQETDEDLERRERRRKVSEDDPQDNVVPLRQKQRATPFSDDQDDDFDLKSGAREGLRQLRLQEPDFDLRGFIQGARSAYQIIVEAYSEGDMDTLKDLVTDQVYQQFDSVIQHQITHEGTITKTKMERIDRSDIEGIEVKDNLAKITIRFRSRQIIITKSASGKIVDNPAEISVPITDIWTFVRTLNAADPTWLLKATASESYRN